MRDKRLGWNQLLMEAGLDGYSVDFRRSTRAYFTRSGETLELSTAPTPTPVAEAFNAAGVREAIREAQILVPGYTYTGFCGETHTEYFPGTQSATKL